MWTGTSRTWRTRSARPPWTGWSRKRSAGSCPTPPNRPAATPRTDGTVHHRPPAGLLRRHLDGLRRARPRRRPGPRRRDPRHRRTARRPRLPPSPSTYAGRWPPGNSPAANSPSTSPPHPIEAEPSRRSATHQANGALRAPLPGRHHRHRRVRADLQVGRVENTRTPVTADQIRDWCGHPDTQVIREAGDRPGRARPRRRLRDPRPAHRTDPPARRHLRLPLVHPHPPDRCDSDHVIPHARGGPTCSQQHRTPVPAPSPAENPQPLDLHRPRTRHLPVVQPTRLPVPPRPPGTLDVSRDKRRPSVDPPET